MKTKMKTKMKTIMSACMLMGLLYACTSDSAEPLDCMRIENGSAITDDCGDCHKWIAYNYIDHTTREVNDTINEVLGENEMFASPNNPMNPAWNACPDCNGISNGVAIMDSCRVCHQSYVYDFATHIPTYIEDTAGLLLGATEMLILAGSPEDVANNPNWNNCK